MGWRRDDGRRRGKESGKESDKKKRSGDLNDGQTMHGAFLLGRSRMSVSDFAASLQARGGVHQHAAGQGRAASRPGMFRG
jgi:hypothetical protein